jgi:phosphate binding protein/phosphate/phosphite/phosphonate ABC transporter binding protein
MNNILKNIFIIIILIPFILVINCSKKIEKVEKKEIIRVAGSAPAIPLLNALAEEYKRINPDIEIRFLPSSHSAGGIVGAKEGEYDIGLMTRELKKQEERFKIRYLHLAEDGLVFATNKNVKVKNLTTKQIIDIYRGKINNWKEVGGKDKKIMVLDRGEHTSAKIILRNRLFKDMEIRNDAIVLERPEQMDESLKLIPNSIGYTSFGGIISKDLEVNLLSIDGVAPTQRNVATKKYKFSRPFGIVVKENPDKKTMHFISFIFSDDGRRIIESRGYIPVLFHLVIGIVPEQDVLKQEMRYSPLIKYLSKELGMGVRVNLRHFTSYGEIINAFLKNDINSAFLGSFVYGIIKTKKNIVPLVRPEKRKISWYRGLIFVRKDSGIKNIKDLKGKTFAMIKNTTAGDLFPKIYFKRNKIKDMNKYLGKIYYLASHDLSIIKVLNGDIDAGAAKDLIFYKLAKSDPRISNDLVIIAKSTQVPENAFVVSKDIEIKCYECHKRRISKYYGKPDIIKRLQDAFLNLSNTKEGRELLRRFGADRFIKTEDSGYNNLYKMFKELNINLKDYRYNS